MLSVIGIHLFLTFLYKLKKFSEILGKYKYEINYAKTYNQLHIITTARH